MKYLEIGKIVNTHGLKGELRVVPYTDDPSRFELLKQVEVIKKNDILKYEIQRVKYQKSFILLKLADVDTIEAAEKLKDTVIRIPYEMGLPLEEDEYFIGDLYDIRVETEQGEFLGEISDIIFTGANDVYVVSKTGSKDILLPALKSCILKVDIANNIMIVKLPEGL